MGAFIPMPELQAWPTIGIVTALEKEYAAVEDMMDNTFPHSVPGRGAGRRYLLGEMPASGGGKHTVVLVLAEEGNIRAGNRATLLLEHYKNVSSILMVGIAGGVPNPNKPDDHVRVGDVVVSDRYGVTQYDYETDDSLKGLTPRHLPRPPSATLLEAFRLLQVDELRGRRPWLSHTRRVQWASRPPDDSDVLFSSSNPEEIINHPNDTKRSPGQPRVFGGAIAAAHVLLKNPVRRDELRDRYRAKAVEMESSGIADATWNHEVGYLVVRGICDYCDTHKSDGWQEYAAVVAAAYTRGFLESIAASPVGGTTQRVSNTVQPADKGPSLSDSGSVRFDPSSAFMGEDVDAGRRALNLFLAEGERSVPHVIDLLSGFLYGDMRRTHGEQVHYRFKKFFAEFEEASADILTQLVLDGSKNIGAYAAECFDFFTRENVKQTVANRLARTLDSPFGDLLSRRNQVRNTILALGYLGALDWRYAILDVLEKTRGHLDEPFRFFALNAYARLIQKGAPRVLRNIPDLLKGVFEGFASGSFGPTATPVSEEEVLIIKRVLRQRKTFEGVGQFLLEVRCPWGNHSEVQDLVRECYAHLLGSLGLPRTVPVLRDILFDAEERVVLRAQCALALAGIRNSESATALRQAAEHPAAGRFDPVRSLALYSLTKVVHLGSHPHSDLGYVFEGSEPVGAAAPIRAIGLCKIDGYGRALEEWLTSDDAETRGQAGLALARVYGTKYVSALRSHLAQADSHDEQMLFSMAILEAGEDPGLDFVRWCMQQGFLEWPEPIVEDVFLILDKGPGEYRDLAASWKDIADTLPSNLDRDYGEFSQLRAVPMAP